MKHFFTRTSYRRYLVKKGALKNLAKFTGKHLCLSFFFFDKVQATSSNFVKKKRLWHRCFPVNFVKFLRTAFYRTRLNDCFYIESSSGGLSWNTFLSATEKKTESFPLFSFKVRTKLPNHNDLIDLFLVNIIWNWNIP